MKTLLAFRKYFFFHSRTEQNPFTRIIVLICLLPLIFAGTLFAGGMPATHMPGTLGHPSSIPIPKKLPTKITVRPSTLIMTADLAVTGLSFERGAKGKIWAVIEVKNEGKASSKPARGVVLVTRGDGTHEKGAFEIKALKPGTTVKIKRSIHVTPGKNIVKIVVSDRINTANNTLEKPYMILPAEAAKAVTHPRFSNMKAIPKEKHAAGRVHKPGRLVVQDVSFNDHLVKAPGASRVTLAIKNEGKAVTPPTSLRVLLKRSDGKREEKILKVPPLKPGQAIFLHGTFQMSKGYNTLQVFSKTFRSVALFHAGKALFTRTHYFHPLQLSRGKSVLTTVSPPRVKGEKRTPEAATEAGKILKAAENLKKKKPGISTYGGSLQGIIAPRGGEVVCPNTTYTVTWALDALPPDAHLKLILFSEETPAAIPALELASDMDPSARSYDWNVGNLPPGRYQLELQVRTSQGTAFYDRDFRIDHVRLHISNFETIPSQPVASRPTTVKALITNTGADATRAFTAKMTIYCGGDFFNTPLYFAKIKSKRFSIHGLRNGGGYYISLDFIPPITGLFYWAVVEPDIDGIYPGDTASIEDTEKTYRFTVQAMPDLVVNINKVTNGRLTLDEKEFDIRVKNIGAARSPQTTVTFFLTDTGEHHYTVPALNPGEAWEKTYSKRWHSFSGDTGIKVYWAKVDPDDQIRELDESNNYVRDQFTIYRAGEAIPKTTVRPAVVIVKNIYGLPSPLAPITENSENVPHIWKTVISFQCISPDREIFPEGWNVRMYWTTPSGQRLKSPYLGNLFWSNIGPALYPGEIMSKDVTFIYPDPSTQEGTYDLHGDLYDSEGHFVSGLFEREYTFVPPRESPSATNPHEMAWTEKNAREPRSPETGQSNNLDLEAAGQLARKKRRLQILNPTGGKVWTHGKTYQIAWIGEATGPYTVTLVPEEPRGNPIQIASNNTVNFQGYTVDSALTSGRYHIMVEGKDGWGNSEPFFITDASKPNLKPADVTISSELSENTQAPYRIKVRFKIENDGAYESKPFQVRVACMQGNDWQKNEYITVGPMLDNRSVAREVVFDSPRAGTYQIYIDVNSDFSHRVEESDIHDNTYSTDHTVWGVCDLRVGCRQAGRNFYITVKNIGHAPTGAGTSVIVKWRTSQILPNSSSWHREGAYMVSSPIPVPPLKAGEAETFEPPAFPANFYVGDSYIVTVDPDRDLRELCYQNNFVKGFFKSPYQHHSVTIGSMKAIFGIRDETNLTIHVSSDDAHPVDTLKAHPAFHFVIWNKTSHVMAPPVQIVLEVYQGSGVGQHFLYFNVPVLFGGGMGIRDEFRIDVEDFPYDYPAVGGDIHYRLWAQTPSGTESSLIHTGSIEVKISPQSSCGN